MTDNQIINDLSNAIELNPQDKEAYIKRGKAYFQLKEYEKAIEDCTKAIELDPELEKLPQ